MKRSILSILGLTALMTLTGCDATNNSTKPSSDDKYEAPVRELLLDRKSATLLVGETLQLNTLVKPLTSSSATLIYSSSNSNIASVSKSGKITAKKAGHASISVKTKAFVSEEATPDQIDVVDVYVTKSAANKMEAVQLNSEMSSLNKRCYVPDNVRLYDYRIYDLRREGVSQDKTEEFQRFVVSQSEGLMAYDSYEIDINVCNGAPSYVTYGYTAHTTNMYSSYIYHRSEDIKRYYYAATEFNMGKATRFDTMCQILDSIFSVEHDYFTGCLDDIVDYSVSPNDNISFYKSGDDFYLAGTSEFEDEDYDVFDVEDEIRYVTQIPAGIPYGMKYKATVTYLNGYQRELSYSVTRTFKWNNANYEYETILKQRYDIISDDEVAEYIPGDDYDQVWYYYDI